MFNKDAIFGKKDGNMRKEHRNVNVTPALTPTPAVRPQPESTLPEQPAPETAKTRPEPAESKGSQLIVGPDIKLKGVEITDCDTLVVEGRVEAAMDSRVIRIAEQGVFAGTVGIDVAEIRGRFEGELTARKQLVIHATGRVSGKIRYGSISVEEGGELTGDIATIAAHPGVTRSANATAASNDIMTAYDPFARKASALQPAKS